MFNWNLCNSLDTQTESNKSDVVSEGVLAVCAEEPKTEQPNVEQENETSSTYDNKDSDDIDPKIRKGLEKIKKLDTILSEKVKVLYVTVTALFCNFTKSHCLAWTLKRNLERIVLI